MPRRQISCIACNHRVEKATTASIVTSAGVCEVDHLMCADSVIDSETFTVITETVNVQSMDDLMPFVDPDF